MTVIPRKHGAVNEYVIDKLLIWGLISSTDTLACGSTATSQDYGLHFSCVPWTCWGLGWFGNKRLARWVADAALFNIYVTGIKASQNFKPHLLWHRQKKLCNLAQPRDLDGGIVITVPIWRENCTANANKYVVRTSSIG